jgi:hypothetical protein
MEYKDLSFNTRVAETSAATSWEVAPVAPNLSPIRYDEPYEQAQHLQSDALRRAQERKEMISTYLNADETVKGFGYGGSESLTMFLQKPDGKLFVRKVLSERLVTPQWERDGRDVMLPPCLKAKSQVEYLQGLPASAKPFFPEVLNVTERDQIVIDGNRHTVYQEFIYDMTYIPGIEISKFVRQYQPSPQIVAILYSEIFRILNEKVHSQRRRVPRQPTLEQSYFSKIEKRLALSQATAPKTFSDSLLRADEIVINGKKMRNVPLLLKTFRNNPQFLEVLKPKFHALVVGDTNTENIKIGNIQPLLMRHENPSFTTPLFTAEELQIRFLDPRAIGFHEDGKDTGADDPMYDNKPWHNCLGNYDKIHGEHFNLAYKVREGISHLAVAFHEDNPYAVSYDGIEKYFAEAMTTAWKLDDPTSDVCQNDPYWLIRFVFLMGTHFMAMPPFHFSKEQDGSLIDDTQHQSRPLAIYAEGIKWLNLTLDMLEGNVTTFLGVPIPRIGT